MGQGLGDWDGDVGCRDVALGDVALGHSGDAGTWGRGTWGCGDTTKLHSDEGESIE